MPKRSRDDVTAEDIDHFKMIALIQFTFDLRELFEDKVLSMDYFGPILSEHIGGHIWIHTICDQSVSKDKLDTLFSQDREELGRYGFTLRDDEAYHLVLYLLGKGKRKSMIQLAHYSDSNPQEQLDHQAKQQIVKTYTAIITDGLASKHWTKHPYQYDDFYATVAYPYD